MQSRRSAWLRPPPLEPVLVSVRLVSTARRQRRSRQLPLATLLLGRETSDGTALPAGLLSRHVVAAPAPAPVVWQQPGPAPRLSGARPLHGVSVLPPAPWRARVLAPARPRALFLLPQRLLSSRPARPQVAALFLYGTNQILARNLVEVRPAL